MTIRRAIGIDIGGTGIKGGIVDLVEGELLSERRKLPTPAGGEPEAIIEVAREMLVDLDSEAGEHLPLGVCFPAVVKNGRTMSAANVSKKWINLPAETLFEKELGRKLFFANDADAAGYEEVVYGAAKGHQGLVILTTLGTGIGTALLYEGRLFPHAELGHLEIEGKDAEETCSYSAKERLDLSWKAWSKNLQKYYSMLEKLFSPDLFIVGGGVSKHADDFFPLLDLKTEIVPAKHLNNAGIIGAAALAATHQL